MFRKHFPAPFKITLLCLTASKFFILKDGQHVRQRSILECMSTTPPKRRDSTKDEESYFESDIRECFDGVAVKSSKRDFGSEKTIE